MSWYNCAITHKEVCGAGHAENSPSSALRSSEIGGFRIFKVNDGSPAAEAGLEVFFDFIVEINGVLMDADQTTFAKAIQDAENQRTKLVVQNIRTHTPGHSVDSVQLTKTLAIRNGG